MSADNCNHVKRVAHEHWAVWLNLSASDDVDEQLKVFQPSAHFKTEREAVEWANAQGYTEWGTSVDDGSDPDAYGSPPG